MKKLYLHKRFLSQNGFHYSFLKVFVCFSKGFFLSVDLLAYFTVALWFTFAQIFLHDGKTLIIVVLIVSVDKAIETRIICRPRTGLCAISFAAKAQSADKFILTRAKHQMDSKFMNNRFKSLPHEYLKLLICLVLEENQKTSWNNKNIWTLETENTAMHWLTTHNFAFTNIWVGRWPRAFEPTIEPPHILPDEHHRWNGWWALCKEQNPKSHTRRTYFCWS